MIVIYTTYPNKEEGEIVSRALLEKRLVACANILAAHESLYWWDGEIQSEQEVAVIYKTQDKLFDSAKDKIVSLHSYDVPCVVSWRIDDGHDAFMKWIGEETVSKA